MNKQEILKEIEKHLNSIDKDDLETAIKYKKELELELYGENRAC